MTTTIPMHKDRATRGPGLHLVDSQVTERYQAVDPPESGIYGVTEWYGKRQWPAWLLLILGCALLGAAVVAAVATW